MAATGNKKRRRLMSEINVVPYIDVMLVLLVIFMVTAPLLTPGVMVELAEMEADPLPGEGDEPLVITVDAKGDFYLSVGENLDEPLGNQALVTKVGAVLRHRPGTPVYVRGDAGVLYEQVITAISLLKEAGVPDVGLITKSPEL